jgi:hypothetical protein
LTIIRLWRWANAVASAGTRAIAPPSTSECRPRHHGEAGALFVGIDLGVLHRPQEVGDRLGQGAERRDGAPAGPHLARVDHPRHDDEAGVQRLGHERHRRRGHHVLDRAQLVRGRLGLRDEAGDHLGRRGQQEQAADDRVDRMKPVLQARDDAEVAAAAPQRPEQLGLGPCVHAAQPPVGGDDLRRQHAVDRQPVLADEEADAARERDAADPDRARVAEAGREPVPPRRDRVRAGGETRARPGRAPGGIELERSQGREVDHDAAVGDTVAGGAVTAAADRELGPGLAGVGDDPGDVVGPSTRAMRAGRRSMCAAKTVRASS